MSLPLGEAIAIVGFAILLIGLAVAWADGYGNGSAREAPTLDVQNHLGDPDGPSHR